MGKLYRQGEVLIRQLEADKVPDYKAIGSFDKLPVFTKRKSGVIVEGEVTGHMHRASVGTLYEKGNELFLSTKEATEITHDEHATIKLPKGDFEITFQREYDENNRFRRVID